MQAATCCQVPLICMQAATLWYPVAYWILSTSHMTCTNVQNRTGASEKKETIWPQQNSVTLIV